MIRFDDQVVLVVGGARGLGFSYAQNLAERGATVILHDVGADTNGEGHDATVAETAAAELRFNGGRAFAASHDLLSDSGCRQLTNDVVERHGRIDAVIFNAGWVGYQSIEEQTDEFVERMLSITIRSPLRLAQSIWPVMKRQRYGRLVLTSSDRAIYPEYGQVGLTAYAAGKMAVIGISNVLAVEGAEHGIRVNCVSPVAKTRMWGISTEPVDLRPSDVAAGVLYLASAACQATGWVLRAANGQFRATKALDAEDVTYPTDICGVKAEDVDKVAERWSEIARPSPESGA